MEAGAGPGDGVWALTSTACLGEVCGRLEQGAAYGYTQLLGYHPILATRADARETPAHPPAQGVGEHAEGDRALLR